LYGITSKIQLPSYFLYPSLQYNAAILQKKWSFCCAMKDKLFAKICPEILLVCALLLLNLFCVIFRFFPAIRDISLWDDAGYIYRGKLLMQGG
jgi:hypothetical protein